MSITRGEGLQVPRSLVDLVRVRTLCRQAVELPSTPSLRVIPHSSSSSLPHGSVSVSTSLAIASLVSLVETKTRDGSSSTSPPLLASAHEIAIAMHEASENARVRAERAIVDEKYEDSLVKLRESRHSEKEKEEEEEGRRAMYEAIAINNELLKEFAAINR